MLGWIQSSAGTIIVLLIVAAIVALIIVNLVKDKKKGKSSCGSGCKGCPMSGSCHNNKS